MVCPPGKPPFPASGALGGASGARALARTTREPSFSLLRAFSARVVRSYGGGNLLWCARRETAVSRKREPSAERRAQAPSHERRANPLFHSFEPFRRASFVPTAKKVYYGVPAGKPPFPQAGTLGGASGASALARTTREPSFSLLRAFSARVVRPAAGTLKRGGTDTSLFHPFWCARRESNPEPTASEAVTLSNCATDTRAALCRRLCLSL